jgi:RND family efflux transporter MFP subunit
MRKLLRVGLTLLVVAAAIVSGTWVWDHYLYSPWTRDGRIRADIITIAPDASGWVTELAVRNNQAVSKGDPLFVIDNARYQVALAESEAKLVRERTTWELARYQYERRDGLSGHAAVSEEDLETSRIRAESAKAAYELAKTELNSARLDLQRTRVLAPADGWISNLNLNEGNYVTRGTPVMSLIEKGSFYVTGYFEETKLQLVHTGQRARVTLLAGGETLSGTVISIASGIADTNADSNHQLLPQVQQVFNWVRLAQRIPVDIELDPFPENIHISAGMTVSVYLEDN